MLEWLTRLLLSRERGQALAPAREPFGVRVATDPDVISISRAGAPEEVMMWEDIASIGIVSGGADQEPPELYWLLQGRDRRRALLVPMGAPGEHDFVHAMQERFQGFDNMAVIEAMSATGSIGFTIWDEDWPRGSGESRPPPGLRRGQ